MKTFEDFTLEEELLDEDLDDLLEEDEELFNELYTLTEEDLIEAPLTVTQRRKRARLFKRLAPRIARARERKKKRLASPENILKRAGKQARNLIRNRLSPNKPYAQLGVQAKIAIDKKLEKRKSAIKRIMKRILPKVKRGERERLATYRKNQSQLAGSGAK